MNDRKPKQYFSDHEQMDFETQIILGSCYYGGADAGEVLATVARIPSGDFEKWYEAWTATADRVAAIAEKSAADGHRVSARRAFLRAAGCTG